MQYTHTHKYTRRLPNQRAPTYEASGGSTSYKAIQSARCASLASSYCGYIAILTRSHQHQLHRQSRLVAIKNKSLVQPTNHCPLPPLGHPTSERTQGPHYHSTGVSPTAESAPAVSHPSIVLAGRWKTQRGSLSACIAFPHLPTPATVCLPPRRALMHPKHGAA